MISMEDLVSLALAAFNRRSNCPFNRSVNVDWRPGESCSAVFNCPFNWYVYLMTEFTG